MSEVVRLTGLVSHRRVEENDDGSNIVDHFLLFSPPLVSGLDNLVGGSLWLVGFKVRHDEFGYLLI